MSAAVATAAQSNILSWVMFGINVLILISNTFLDLYRKWRDRDEDKEKKDEEDNDVNND